MIADALPNISVIDIRKGGCASLARLCMGNAQALLHDARRNLTPPLLMLMDNVSRRWLDNSGNPYRAEIAEIAGLLRRHGAYALNTSYEWACTSGVGPDPRGGVRLLRVLDWRMSGLGRNVVVAWQGGPAGEFANITWPGFVGAITAAAPGRFAAAINQPPMTATGVAWPIDWAVARARVWRSRGMPPSHLLRHVFETCATYLDAKHRLATTPMALPAFFILAGTRPGEGCVIERTEDAAIIREMPAAIANHWVGLPQGGRPRGHNSDERHRRMEDAVNNESAEWLAAPVLNRDTRIIATINLSQSQMMLQGWEASGPATAELRLDLASGPEFTLN